MAGFTNYLEQKVLGLVFGNVAYTIPTTYHIGLHVGATAPDQEAGTGVVEPTDTAYARQPVTNAGGFTAPTQNANGQAEVSNVNGLTFPKATADWGTATHFVIYDDATTPNIVAIGALGTAKAIATGDQASFASNALKITLD